MPIRTARPSDSAVCVQKLAIEQRQQRAPTARSTASSPAATSHSRDHSAQTKGEEEGGPAEPFLDQTDVRVRVERRPAHVDGVDPHHSEPPSTPFVEGTASALRGSISIA